MGPDLIYYSDNVKKALLVEEFSEQFGPYCYGQIIEVPNMTKNMTHYQILHDRTKITDNIDKEDCCFRLPGIESVKKLSKTDIGSAHVIDYRSHAQMNQLPKQTGKKATVSVDD